MAVKIHYPKPGTKHTQKLIIIQGTCDNSAKATGVLTNSGGQAVAGTKLTTANLKHWGYRYKLGKDSYHFTLTQTNSPAITASVDFSVAPAAPPPQPLPPTVTSPVNDDEVASVFYPFGTSNAGQQITNIDFAGNGQDVAGTVIQQTDPDGDWEGEVDASALPTGNGYTLTVSNASGDTQVTGLSIASS